MLFFHGWSFLRFTRSTYECSCERKRDQTLKAKLEVYHIIQVDYYLSSKGFLPSRVGCLPLTCAAVSVLPAQSEVSFFSSCLDGAALLGLFSREESEPEESNTVAVLGACAPTKK